MVHTGLTTTERGIMPTKNDAISKLIGLGAPALAEAIVNALAPAGALDEWDSETIEYVLTPLDKISKLAGLKPVGNSNIQNTAFWQEINGDTKTVWVAEHDDMTVGYVVNELSDMEENFEDIGDPAFTLDEYLASWTKLEIPEIFFDVEDLAERNTWIKEKI
jgi:hypothetical protein